MNGVSERRRADQIRAAWAALIDQADTIADSITQSLLEREHEFYDAAPSELRADLRKSTRDHITRGLQTMAGLNPPDRRAVDVFRETGRRRAQQGVPMEQVLNAYALGCRVLWEALVQRASAPGATLDMTLVVQAGQQLWAAMDIQNAAMVEAYRRESARLQRRDLHRQKRLLDALADGRSTEEHVAADVRDVLGIGPDVPIACVVAPFDGRLDEPLRGLEDRVERRGTAAFVHVRGDAQFALVPLTGISVDDLVAALREGARGRVGVAAADEVAGFARAYLLASGAADTLPRGVDQVATSIDRLPEMLVAASPEIAGVLLDETLGPVLAQPSVQATALVETLAALLEHNASPTRAAEALYCHRNTVIYRMRQLETLTGRSLQDTRDRLLFSLALTALGRPGT